MFAYKSHIVYCSVCLIGSSSCLPTKATLFIAVPVWLDHLCICLSKAMLFIAVSVWSNHLHVCLQKPYCLLQCLFGQIIFMFAYKSHIVYCSVRLVRSSSCLPTKAILFIAVSVWSDHLHVCLQKPYCLLQCLFGQIIFMFAYKSHIVYCRVCLIGSSSCLPTKAILFIAVSIRSDHLRVCLQKPYCLLQCPFGRIIFVFAYKNTTLLHQLQGLITAINARALDLDDMPQQVIDAALSTYKLSM